MHRTPRRSGSICVLTASLASLCASAAFADGPITAADGLSLYPFQLGNLTDQATITLGGSSDYFNGTQQHDGYTNSLTSTGFISDSHNNVELNGAGGASPGAYVGLYAAAGGASGQLHAGVFGYASGESSEGGGTATASIGDTLHLAADTSFTLAANLSGFLGRSAGLDLASGRVDVDIYVVAAGSADENGQYLVQAGYQYEAAAPFLGGVFSDKISANFDLPAGNYFYFAQLQSEVIAETSLASDGASATSDFAHTIDLSIVAPAGSITSDLGSVPVVQSVVPEPTAIVMLSVAPLLLARRRRA